jgi:hypothetical protein
MPSLSTLADPLVVIVGDVEIARVVGRNVAGGDLRLSSRTTVSESLPTVARYSLHSGSLATAGARRKDDKGHHQPQPKGLPHYPYPGIHLLLLFG